MDPWAKNIAAVTLFVEDLAAARQFYADVFELEVYFEDATSTVYKIGSTLVNLLQVDAAPELITPAVVAGPEAGNRYQFTVEVDDVDELCERLVAKGVTLLNGPLDRPWGIRTASFQDPSGHIWEIAR